MIIYAIDLWHRRHLRIPTVMEWHRAGPDNPCRSTVMRVFGSWNAAIEAAGFHPRAQGESRHVRRRFRDASSGELLPVSDRPPNGVAQTDFHGWR
jgi:hypothetical protein